MNYTYEGSIAQAIDAGYNGICDQGIYKGRLINKYLKFTEIGYFKFEFKIISKSSKYLQAGVIMMSKVFKADFYINGKKVAKPKGRFPKIELWENDVPSEFSVFVHLQEGAIYILNANAISITKELTYCRMMKGGCSIYIEKFNDYHYRLHCNDIEIDDDFDDLVFDISFIKYTDEQEWLSLAKSKENP